MLKPIPISELVSHLAVDFDECLGMFQFRVCEEAEKFFPGANNVTKITFVNAGRIMPDGRIADEAWMRRYSAVAIGCGGWWFDEHKVLGRNQSPEQAKKCSAELVAKFFGIQDKPELQPLLRFARDRNNRARAELDDISLIIKRLHENNEINIGWLWKVSDPQKVKRIHELMAKRPTLEEIYLWMEDAIYAKYREEQSSPGINDFSDEHIAELIAEQNPNELWRRDEWLQLARDALELSQLLFETLSKWEYDNKKCLIPFRGMDKFGKVREMRIFAIHSDDPQVTRYARSKLVPRECLPAVLIQRRSSGHVIILTNQVDGVNVSDLACAIKVVEAWLRDEPVPSWEELRDAFEHFGWYYSAERGQQILNGSRTAPGATPTQQSLEDIIQLARDVLSIEEFEKGHQAVCRKGRCTASGQHPCTWYDLGLRRCREIRFREFRAIQAK